MLIAVLIIAVLILALLFLALFAEVQSTIAFVVDKGGFWLNYSTGIGGYRLTGIQIRMMTGRRPRAWMLVPLSGRFKQVEFGKTIRSMTNKKWKPLRLPLRGILDIGVSIIIRELNVQAKLGVENDAAATALLCGTVVTMLQTLRAVSTRGEFMPRGIIAIKPVFNKARLSVRFKCILAIKARNIIREVIQSYARRKSNVTSY